MSTIIYNYRTFVSVIEPESLVEIFSGLLDNSGYTTINFTEHHFQPQGYTSLWLLAESHLALHTFPEANRTYVELSGCRDGMNEKFIALLQSMNIIISEEKSDLTE